MLTELLDSHKKLADAVGDFMEHLTRVDYTNKEGQNLITTDYAMLLMIRFAETAGTTLKLQQEHKKLKDIMKGQT